MRVTLSDARESPLAAAIFAVGVVAAGVALVAGDGEFDADPGSALFLVGAGFVAVAIVATVTERLRG